MTEQKNYLVRCPEHGSGVQVVVPGCCGKFQLVGTYTKSEKLAQMRAFEEEYGMSSHLFFDLWEEGKLANKDAFFVWASLCSMYGGALAAEKT